MKRHYKANKNAVSAILLCLSLIVCSFIACYQVERTTREQCFRVLQETTEQGADSIRLIMESEEAKVRIVADMLADHTVLDETTTAEYLASADTSGLVSSYSVLLPDDTLVHAEGSRAELPETPAFAAELEKGSGYVTRFSASDGTQYIAVRMLIQETEGVRGILYGLIDLKDLPSCFDLHAYHDQCQMYLVDGTNGDFLMDTWHDSLSNLYDGEMNRKIKAGDTDYRESILNGESGYLVFESKTTGDDFYTYFAPVGVYNLSFQITVAHRVAFAESIRIQEIVYLVCGLQIFLCMLYAVLMLFHIYRNTNENTRRLEMSAVTNEVQQILFSAYKNPFLINRALERIAHAIGSPKAVLFVLDGEDEISNLYGYPIIGEQEKESLIGENLKERDPAFYWKLMEGQKVILNRGETATELTKAGEVLHVKGLELENLIAARIMDQDNQMCGILCAANAQDAVNGVELLQSMTDIFRRSLQAISSYAMAHQMGTIDSLTGLKNRNAYQKELPAYSVYENGRLCCAYVDANGLHDINNQFGHSAGDKMLQAIAEQIKNLFGFEHCYRIGGDEFVLFGIDVQEDDIKDQLRTLQHNLAVQEYYASAGYAYRKTGQTVRLMLQEAEKRMYQDKASFYSGRHERRSQRQLNQNLEKVLLEKKDRDCFLAAISDSYLGVYAVNLDADETRVIYRPEYFAAILELNHDCFRPSLEEYADRFVREEDLEAFRAAVDYGAVTKQMAKKQAVEFTYRKADGEHVRMRVLPAEDYTDDHKNTLWIFEDTGTPGGPDSGDGQAA